MQKVKKVFHTHLFDSERSFTYTMFMTKSLVGLVK